MVETLIPKKQTVERSFFTLDGVARKDRFDVWKDSISCIYDVDAPRDIRNEDFAANLTSWRHQDMLMIQAQSRSQRFVRSSQMFARDGMDHYNIQIYTDGVVQSELGRGGTSLGHGGGFLLLDCAQHTEAQTSEFDSLHLFIPRQPLEERLINPDDHNLRFLTANDPIVRLAHDQIMTLHNNIDFLADDQIAVLKQTIVMLLANSMNSAYRETAEMHAQRQDIEKQVMIRRYFRDNLLSPDLTPEKAASDLGVSRAALYRLFDAYGGVKNHVRDMRLKHGLKLLNDPKQIHRSVYDIGLECGYTSDASFIRAFRAKYDITPGDVRAGHRPTPAAKRVSNTIDTRYENWLHSLG